MFKAKIFAGGILAVLLGAGLTRVTYSMIQGAPTNVIDKGADPLGNNDSSAAFQRALDTGRNVYCPSGTYKIVTSLYMNTSGQEFSGDCVLTMDASLAKPVLWLGASSAAGAVPSSTPVNMKVRGIRFSGTGTKTSGSSGISFKQATTTTVDSVFSWNFYAGIDVRGISLVNHIVNADLRQNNYGFWDKTDGTATINFQGSVIHGGRIESNVQEGAVVGSSDIRFIGTVFEGNSNIPLGGTGTLSEVRITQGFNNGSFDFTDCYFEVLGGNTPPGIIQVDANACKKVTLKGGNFFGNDAANRYVINDASNCTTKSYTILGSMFTGFKNYISGTIANNSFALIMPGWTDLSVDASVALTVSGGATLMQLDRIIGLKLTGATFGKGFKTDGVTGSDAITIATSGARLHLGAGTVDYLYSDGTNTKSDGKIIATHFLMNGGYFGNNAATSTSIQGAIADGANAVATKVFNANTLSTATTKITCFYPDNATTVKVCIDLMGAYVPVGLTFANIATGSVVNGTLQYCTDCTIANPCAGGGTGAYAKRLNGVWVCN